MDGRGDDQETRPWLSFAGAGGCALALLASWGACDPDFAALVAGRTSEMGGTGGTTSSSTGTTSSSTGTTSSSTGTTSSSTGTATVGSGGATSTSSSSASTSSSSGSPDAGPLFSFTFDTDIEGWTGRTYDSSLVNPTVAYSTLGHTAPGSVEGTMNFSDANQAQYVRYVPTPKPDLTGKTVTAWVYVESTVDTVEFTAFAEDVPNVTFMNGVGVNVGPTATPRWIPLTFTIPPKSAAWDPTNINQFGVQAYTLSAADAGTTDAGATSTTVVAVDDVFVQ